MKYKKKIKIEKFYSNLKSEFISEFDGNCIVYTSVLCGNSIILL